MDTGDDNCAVKEGTRNVLVDTCDFRNGHGSSIGSLGEGGSYGEVSNIVMRNIVFNQTQNAARIKTWQGGTGAVRNITYSVPPPPPSPHRASPIPTPLRACSRQTAAP